MTKTSSTSRAPLVFAILGLLAALAAGGAYVYRTWWVRDAASPEETVDEFLSAVFANDQARVDAVTCDSWDAAQAIRATKSAIPEGANVSWEDVRLLNANDERAVVQATIGLRPFFDEDISDRIPWAFTLVDDGGWRVCQARPVSPRR